MIKREQLNDYIYKVKIDQPEHFDNIQIACLCCVHVGAVDHDEDLFDKYLDWVKAAPNRYIMSIGDLGDYSIPTHMSAAGIMWAQNKTPREQANEIAKKLEPVKDRIIGLVEGNHELRIWKRTEFYPSEIIADKLGISDAFMGIAAYIILEVNGIEYKTFWIHGERNGLPETPLRYAYYGGRANTTDFFVMGHSHTFATREFTRLEFGESGSHLKRTTGIRTASFIRDPDYAKRKITDIQYLGASIVTLGTERKNWSVDNSGEFKFREVVNW